MTTRNRPSRQPSPSQRPPDLALSPQGAPAFGAQDAATPKTSTGLVTFLVAMLAVCAGAAAVIGLLATAGNGPTELTTAFGETVTLHGRGLYQYDLPLMAIGFLTQDAVLLLVGLPALLIGLGLYRRGSVRGGVLLTGALAYILYDELSLAFGAAYNPLLGVYIAALALSLVALLMTFVSLYRPTVTARLSAALPRKGVGAYLIFVGAAFWILWGGLDLIPALASGRPPTVLAHYTTVITYVVDMGLLTPLMGAAGLLLLRRAPLGALAAGVLIVFSVLLNIQLAVMGVVQFREGLMSLPAFIAFSISFDGLALVAVGFALQMGQRLGRPLAETA